MEISYHGFWHDSLSISYLGITQGVYIWGYQIPILDNRPQHLGLLSIMTLKITNIFLP